MTRWTLLHPQNCGSGVVILFICFNLHTRFEGASAAATSATGADPHEAKSSTDVQRKLYDFLSRPNADETDKHFPSDGNDEVESPLDSFENDDGMEGLDKRPQGSAGMKYIGLGRRNTGKYVSRGNTGMKYIGIGKKSKNGMKYIGIGKRNSGMKYIGLGKRVTDPEEEDLDKRNAGMKYIGIGKRNSGMKYIGLGKRASPMKYIGIGKKNSGMKYIGLGKRNPMKYIGIGKREEDFDSLEYDDYSNHSNDRDSLFRDHDASYLSAHRPEEDSS